MTMTKTVTIKPKRILALGYSVRHIVCSGSRAGYEMYAADAFGDIDTRRFVKRYFPLDLELPPLQRLSELRNLKDEISKVDGLIIGSGFEHVDFSFLGDSNMRKILGNAPEKMKEISNKAWFASRLDDLNIPHPRTYTGSELAEQIEEVGAEDLQINYPVVAKPACGGGGAANFFCYNEKELIRSVTQLPDFLYQEYIKGIHASVSTISTKKAAVAVSVNEQLLGLEALSAPAPFVYCGNITPFVTKFSDVLCSIAEYLTGELGLIGSNGVDFVITDDGPCVIEVNPRLQGSLDTVERSTGLNVVDAHVKAVVMGELPDKEEVAAERYAVKAIVFSKQEAIVTGNLYLDGRECGSAIADIPARGRIVKAGEPIATGIGIGDSKERACTDAMKNITRIKACVDSGSQVQSSGFTVQG